MRRFLYAFFSLFALLGRVGNLALSVLLVIALGWLDYVTGFEISFSFFYLIPISLITWYVGIREGILFTIIGVLTWLISNWLAGDTYSNEWIRLFNAGVRLTVFSMIAFLLYELKLAIHTERVLARTDFLTGVFNRREFTEQLSLEINRAERLHYPVTFAYIDLDNFKTLNDEKGHSAGDGQLRLIAQTITQVIRKTDLFARLGGDEFGLFLPNVDQVNAKIAIEKVSKAVVHELRLLNSPITLSIGVVTFHTPPDNVDKILNKADALMYQAKQAGKQHAVYFEVK